MPDATPKTFEVNTKADAIEAIQMLQARLDVLKLETCTAIELFRTAKQDQQQILSDNQNNLFELKARAESEISEIRQDIARIQAEYTAQKTKMQQQIL